MDSRRAMTRICYSTARSLRVLLIVALGSIGLPWGAVAQTHSELTTKARQFCSSTTPMS
jgi:hypothetical protein